MKKLIYIFITFFVLSALCGCIQLTGDNAVTSVEFASFPEKAILTTEDKLTAKIVIVQNGDATVYTIEVYKNSYEILPSLDTTINIKVQGNEKIGELGNHELKITIEDFTISHEYRVVDKSSDKLFAGGEGTELKPYLVSNAQELNNIREVCNTGEGFYYTIINDINMSGKQWIPLGSDIANPFRGHITGEYNGKNHTITLESNGYVSLSQPYKLANGTNVIPYGFIAYAAYNVSIKNLTFNVNFKFMKDNTSKELNSNMVVGGVMGTYLNQTVTNSFTHTVGNYVVELDNIIVNGNIEGGKKVAGIVATTYNSDPIVGNEMSFTVKNCINNADIKGTDRAGGIIGTMTGTFENDITIGITRGINKQIIESCVNNGNITSTKEGGTNSVGGIVGYACGPGNYEFTNNTNNGDLLVINGGEQLKPGNLIGFLATNKIYLMVNDSYRLIINGIGITGDDSYDGSKYGID